MLQCLVPWSRAWRLRHRKTISTSKGKTKFTNVCFPPLSPRSAPLLWYTFLWRIQRISRQNSWWIYEVNFQRHEKYILFQSFATKQEILSQFVPSEKSSDNFAHDVFLYRGFLEQYIVYWWNQVILEIKNTKFCFIPSDWCIKFTEHWFHLGALLG